MPTTPKDPADNAEGPMTPDQIDQLGLSPEATRVLKAQLESALNGPAFWAGTITGLVVSVIFLVVGAGFLVWTVPLVPAAIETKQGFLAIPLVIGVGFVLLPIGVIANTLKVLAARRG